MKNKVIFALAVSSLMVSTASSAASLTMRYQYVEKQKVQEVLTRIGGSVGNTIFGVQVTNKSPQSLNHMYLGSAELQLGYRFRFENSTLLTKFDATSLSSGAEWKPSLTYTYSFDNNISVYGRYKHAWFMPLDKEKDGRDKSIFQAGIGYKWNGYDFGLSGDYQYGGDDWNLSVVDGESKNYKSSYNLKIGKKIKKYTPFIEIGETTQGANPKIHGEREMRYRAGVMMTF